MALKIFHTSDLHLGIKFAGHEGAVRDTLVEARFNCLARLVRLANANRCDLFVLAGDLFDRVDVAKRDVIRAAQALQEFEGKLVAVLPGNHDYLPPPGGEAPWAALREKGAHNLLILMERKPYDLTGFDIPAVLYPGPCTSKHSAENAVAWVRGAGIDQGIAHHIGVAHGSLDGVSPDFSKDYYPMTRAGLEACPVQMWLLGHTHIRYPDGAGAADRIFYAGTPEPDGFDCEHSGSAWIHELADDGTRKSTPVETGEYRFRHDAIALAGEQDLAAVKACYTEPACRKLLLKLKLAGRVPEEVRARLPALRSEVEKLLFWLKWDDADVIRHITARDINAIFSAGSFPQRLLMTLAGSPGDCEALQEAHRMVMEVKK
jgi:exonuclease SbcD